MSKKYKMLVFAYCETNLGDDLFLKMLFERYENVEWYIIESKNNLITKMFDEYHVNTITRKDFIKKVYQFDGMINIGGSIFIQTRRWYGLYLKRLFYTLPLKVMNKKIFILGANFGPYKSNIFLKAYKFYMKFVDDVCFREDYSYKLFSNNSKVRIAPDIVFGYQDQYLNETKKENTLGISVMNLKNRANLKDYHSSYIEKMSELVKYSIDHSLEVYLYSFCEEEGDEEAINDIISTLSKEYVENINVVNYRGEINQFLKKFSSMELMVSLRFHSFILSQVYGQDVFPIVYSRKTLNTMEDIGLGEYYIDLEDIESLEIENMFNCIKNNSIDVDKISKLSTEHFRILDTLIKE